MCQEFCTELGAVYMATQFGFECWCSADESLDYERHFEAAGVNATCDLKCGGDEVRRSIMALKHSTILLKAAYKVGVSTHNLEAFFCQTTRLLTCIPYTLPTLPTPPLHPPTQTQHCGGVNACVLYSLTIRIVDRL